MLDILQKQYSGLWKTVYWEHWVKMLTTRAVTMAAITTHKRILDGVYIQSLANSYTKTFPSHNMKAVSFCLLWNRHVFWMTKLFVSIMAICNW